MSGNRGLKRRHFDPRAATPLDTVGNVNIPFPGRSVSPFLPRSLPRWLRASAASLSLMAAAALPASAQVPALAQVPAEAVARALALATEAATAVAPRRARVVAEPGMLDPRLTLAPCAQVQAYLPAGVPAWGRTQVGLRCTGGPVHWRVFLPVNVQIWASGVVSKGPLPSGARLTASQLGAAQVDWSVAGGAFDDPGPLEGRTLTRPLAAGEALRAGDLQARQWFALGETVRVVLEGEGFSVSTEGQALTRGLDGQLARVRTESGRVLAGRAVSDHCLEVSM